MALLKPDLIMQTPFSDFSWEGSEGVGPCALLSPEEPPRNLPSLHLPSAVRTPSLPEPPTRRMSSLITTLASIDEMEPLLFDELTPAVLPPPRMSTKQVGGTCCWLLAAPRFIHCGRRPPLLRAVVNIWILLEQVDLQLGAVVQGFVATLRLAQRVPPHEQYATNGCWLRAPQLKLLVLTNGLCRQQTCCSTLRATAPAVHYRPAPTAMAAGKTRTLSSSSSSSSSRAWSVASPARSSLWTQGLAGPSRRCRP